MNKVLYAREGAKGIMDRTFADFPWQVRVEVDGIEIEVPEVSINMISLGRKLYCLPMCNHCCVGVLVPSCWSYLSFPM